MAVPIPPPSLTSSAQSGVGGGDFARQGEGGVSGAAPIYIDASVQGTAARPWWMGGLGVDFGNRIGAGDGGASGWVVLGLAALAAAGTVYALRR